jgi:phosphatidate phosphatase APP1
VYKQPDHSQLSLDTKAQVFLVGTNFRHLPEEQKNQARNLTAEIFIVQQGNVPVEMELEPPTPLSGPEGVNQGGIAATGGKQSVTMPYLTTIEGDFDDFVQIDSNGLTPGNQTQQIQKLNVHAKGATLGNATAYLVPPEGFTIISDIDDILRVTKIFLPKQGILNTFARPFTPWLNMPSIYAKWSAKIPNLHFHYLTTTPEQATRNYMEFIYANYPLGSFDTRPLNFSNIKETFHIRKFLLDRIFDTYPKRKFILVADTSNPDVMKAYPQLALERPGQVQCIFLRNTSATDEDYFPYDTSRFKKLDQKQYMFFITPDDLANVDIVGGNCYNGKVEQNVTFSKQDELLGVHGDKNKSSMGTRLMVGGEGWAWVAFVAMMFALFV